MRKLLFYSLIALLASACRKEPRSRVELYLLQSFNRTVDLSVAPGVTQISNAVLAGSPLVADKDIAWYSAVNKTFGLKKDISSQLKDYGPDKAFAVTVNGEPVYYGVFHPAYLSSIVFGIATIDPFWVTGKELPIRYTLYDNNPALQRLDKRNEARLLAALQQSGRLR